MNTLHELDKIYSTIYLKSSYAVETGKILEQIHKTRKYEFLKDRMISGNIDVGVLDLIVSFIAHVETNFASDDQWDMLLPIYIHILKCGYKVGLIVMPALFTYTNIERCKQITLIHAKYNNPLKIYITQQLQENNIYPNLKLFMSWYSGYIVSQDSISYGP